LRGHHQDEGQEQDDAAQEAPAVRSHDVSLLTEKVEHGPASGEASDRTVKNEWWANYP
jgi:hypothetical protein